MSVVDKLKSAIGLDEEHSTYKYECADCGREFTSAKDPERATCSECLSRDVERRGEV